MNTGAVQGPVSPLHTPVRLHLQHAAHPVQRHDGRVQRGVDRLRAGAVPHHLGQQPVAAGGLQQLQRPRPAGCRRAVRGQHLLRCRPGRGSGRRALQRAAIAHQALPAGLQRARRIHRPARQVEQQALVLRPQLHHRGQQQQRRGGGQHPQRPPARAPVCESGLGQADVAGHPSARSLAAACRPVGLQGQADAHRRGARRCFGALVMPVAAPWRGMAIAVPVHGHLHCCCTHPRRPPAPARWPMSGVTG